MGKICADSNKLPTGAILTMFTKIAYATLALLLITHPHVITGRIFSLSHAYAESLLNLLIGAVALAIYLLHAHDVERTNIEKRKIEEELEMSSERLSDAYRYIGEVNQRLPLLRSLTTDLISPPRQGEKAEKAILEDLLATTVVTLAKARWGFFRFIETESAKTLKEYRHVTGYYFSFRARIGNKELLKLAEEEKAFHMRDEIYVIATSDRSVPVRCFFVFAKPEHGDDWERDNALVQAIVDQAQLFYKYLH